jgi:hypothetical protein
MLLHLTLCELCENNQTVLGYCYHSYDWINAYLISKVDTEAKLSRLLKDHINTKVFNKYYMPYFVQAYSLLSSAEYSENEIVFIDKKNYKIKELIAICMKLSKKKL